VQFSVYNFEMANLEDLWTHFDRYEAEAKELLRRFDVLDTDSHFAASEEEQAVRINIKRFPLLATYELALKCSHLFNLLDARGAVSVTERVGIIARIRTLAVGVAKAYALQQES
jgi:glycyl-tRNA synthetase alpha chain